MNAQLETIEPQLTRDAIRTGLDKSSIKRVFLDHLFFLQGKFPSIATVNDHYLALAYVVRDRLLHRWVSSAATYTCKGFRTVAYLSAEFLMGPHLGNNLVNLGIHEAARDAMKELGLDLELMLAQEAEPGLGNGGLGRLAACHLDSLATLEIPTLGYGIRYEYGIFHQELRDSWQVELSDKWLRYGNPWEIENLAQEGRSPATFVENDSELQEVLRMIGSGLFSDGDPGLFQPLLDTLLHYDPFHVFADFAGYAECQQRISSAFRDEETWTRMSILNTARMGWFSSERSISEYCEDIWHLSPVGVQLNGHDGLGFLQSLQ